MRIEIKAEGADAVKRTLANLGRANLDYRKPLAICAARMERSVAENFRNQGIPELGIKWKPLSKMTIRMRQARRKTTMKKTQYSNKALLDTGRLFGSFGALGSPGQIRTITKTALTFGTNLPYSRKQQEGFTNPGGPVEVGAFTRRKTAGKRRSKKNTVKVRAHTRMTRPSTVPARPHLAIKPRDENIAGQAFLEHERQAMIDGGAK